MTAQTLTGTEYEELASRESNGIRVSLRWNRDNDDVKVAVYEATTGSAFELAVGEASPLDVFNHPFAYAASSGLISEATASPQALAQAVLELERQTLSFL